MFTIFAEWRNALSCPTLGATFVTELGITRNFGRRRGLPVEARGGGSMCLL